MTRVYGTESKYIISKAKTNSWFSKIHYYIALFVVAFLLALIFAVIKNASAEDVNLFTFAVTLMAVFFVCAMFLYFYSLRERKANQFNSGRRGEHLVYKTLEGLPNDYCVFADVTIGYGNIDFVVVRPNEVFSIEVKNHGGRVEYNGHGLVVGGSLEIGRSIIRQVKQQEQDLKDFLKQKMGHEVLVIPVLVFANPGCFVEVTKPIFGVPIIHNRLLLRFIQNYARSPKPINTAAIEEFLKPFVNL